MARRSAGRYRRVPFLAAASLTLALTGIATSAYSRGFVDPSDSGVLGGANARGPATTVTIGSSVLQVVSSTGHKLRLRVLGLRNSSGSRVDIQVQSKDRTEEHDWTFPTSAQGVSVTGSGHGRVRLTSTKSHGYATVSLKVAPHGKPILSTCHRKAATKVRHVSLVGTLLLHTRSKGKHAWGNVGSTRQKVRFSTRSKVTWTRPAASNCPTPEFPCRSTFLWQASGGPSGELDFLTSENVGAHATIGGIRFVNLTEPDQATRADILTLPQPTPNQLVVGGDGSATMQATFRGGTATLTAPNPALTQVERCGSGAKRISVESWSADYANGSTPIRLPARVFGAISIEDTPAGTFARVTVQH
ncbi:MAG: hypothetical protein QM747_18905 [Nocardioides sp.]